MDGIGLDDIQWGEDGAYKNWNGQLKAQTQATQNLPCRCLEI